MSENNPDDVLAAFELLLEAVESEIDFIEKVGASAFEQHNHAAAHNAAERAAQATILRDQVVALRKEWETHTASHHVSQEEETMRAERRNLGRLQRGMRTPELAYYQPIL